MQGSINYQSILIISVLAFVTPLLIRSVRRVRIPFVVGEIFVGLIVGKSGFNLVHDDSWVMFLSNLGLAYLMYLSGLEIDFGAFRAREHRRQQIRTLLICGGMLLLSFGLSYLIALGLSRAGMVKHVLFCAFLLTATAPGLLVPLFKERGLTDTDFGQTVLIFSLLCEFVCLIAITFVSSAVSEGFSYRNFLFLLVVAVSVLIYAVAKRMMQRFDFSHDAFRGQHMEVRASFAVILILVALSQAVGAEVVFGSFIAGVIFSVLSGEAREDLKEKVDIIGYGFLVPIFFIEVGVNIDIRSAFRNPRLLLVIPLLLAAFYAVKLLPSLLLVRLIGLRRAVAASFLLSAQLSLMIVGLTIARSLRIVSDATYSVFVFAAVISCLLFPVLFDRVFRDTGRPPAPVSPAVRLGIREVTLENTHLFGRPLREVKFPPSCRIFLIRRGDEEILPNGETVLQEGDVLLLAAIRSHEAEMLRLVKEGLPTPPADG